MLRSQACPGRLGRMLEAALYKAAGTKTGHRRSAEPDWAHVHRELKRKHVTLQILETNISAFILTGIAIAATAIIIVAGP